MQQEAEAAPVTLNTSREDVAVTVAYPGVLDQGGHIMDLALGGGGRGGAGAVIK